jgi:hypothetical protein
MKVEDLIALLTQMSASGFPGQLQAAGLNLAIFEPWTALTDSILASWVAFWAAFLFSRANGSRPVTLWACGFLATAVSALAGVAFHGCRIVFGLSVTTVGLVWKIVPVSAGVATLCFGCAVAIVWLRPRARRIAITLLIIEFGCLLGATFLLAPPRSNSFGIVLFDWAPLLIALLIGAVFHWNDRASRWIAAGVLAVFLAGGVQATGWHKGHPPDANDIFHLIQMAAMYLLYRGGALLGAIT